jgi:ABC-type antimicrobial peptide transport system permease subunit
MRQTGKRSIWFVLVIVILGAAIATGLSQFIGLVIPEGVVREFFLTTLPLGWDPFTLNLQIITFTIGFAIDVSVVSLLGMAIAWYFLRYFK